MSPDPDVGTDFEDPRSDHHLRRRRNTVALVAVAAVLCVVGSAFALVSLTGGQTIEPASGVPAAVDAAPSPSEEATESETAEPLLTGPPPGGNTVTFSSPSGNIGCALDSAGARCDLGEHDWEAPPAPESCTQTWGEGVAVSPEGSGYVCAGDSTLGATTVLEYGTVAQRGTVQCRSEETGMRCEDTSTGHGFEVARATVSLF